MKQALLATIVGALYLLHQDFWFWRAANPLVFGFIPIGLFYHACYTVATALVLWLLVSHAWPSHLEDSSESDSLPPAAAASPGIAESFSRPQSPHDLKPMQERPEGSES